MMRRNSKKKPDFNIKNGLVNWGLLILKQVEELRGKRQEIGICDRGYRGRSKVGDTRIVIPKPPLKRATAYEKQKARK